MYGAISMYTRDTDNTEPDRLKSPNSVIARWHLRLLSVIACFLANACDVRNQHVEQPVSSTHSNTLCEDVGSLYRDQLNDVFSEIHIQDILNKAANEYRQDYAHETEEIDFGAMEEELKCDLIVSTWQFVVEGRYGSFVNGLSRQKREKVNGVILSEHLRLILKGITKSPSDFIANNIKYEPATARQTDEIIRSRLSEILTHDELERFNLLESAK
jgi:hypothetical protein